MSSGSRKVARVAGSFLIMTAQRDMVPSLDGTLARGEVIYSRIVLSEISDVQRALDYEVLQPLGSLMPE
jgi:hypothetical protein